MRASEDVRGLGHKVHAAEHDRLRLRSGTGGVGELEGVANEVGELHHLIPLVEVPEHDDPVAERLLRGADAVGKLLV